MPFFVGPPSWAGIFRTQQERKRCRLPVIGEDKLLGSRKKKATQRRDKNGKFIDSICSQPGICRAAPRSTTNKGDSDSGAFVNWLALLLCQERKSGTRKGIRVVE